MIEDFKKRIALLGKAVEHLNNEDIQTYLLLKKMLKNKATGNEAEFRNIFSRYYGLNIGGLTEDFKNAYFSALFSFKFSDREPPYSDLLNTLYQFTRKNNTQGLPCSFVSKLVAINDESWPIYDNHVSSFFGLSVSYKVSLEMRIEIFIHHMRYLRSLYSQFSTDEEFNKILAHLCKKHPDVEGCHVHRQIDFLVWTVGKNQLWLDKHKR